MTKLSSGNGTIFGGLASSDDTTGSLNIEVGPVGSRVLVSLDGTGQPTFPKQPLVTLAQSMVRLNTANGYGSTNTAIRRFTNVVTNQGTDITYADSATLGTTFTIYYS
jgi:hypothetical protein